MADQLQEVLSKYVPAGVLEAVAEEVREAATPDSFRKELGELGAKAKEADSLRSELESIKSAPKRKEALQRVGINYDAEKKYGQEILDSIPHDKLDDLDFVAQFVQEKGFDADLSQVTPQPQSEAERITQATVDLGTGTPANVSKDARQQEFLDALDKVPDGDKNAMNEVLAKFGMSPATEG